MAVTKKIVLLGDCAVGKTSLIRRYVHDRFDDSYIVTIGSKVTKREMAVMRGHEQVDLNLMIWDVLGREGYTSIHTRTFAGVHGAILVADLTRRETLEALERYWIPLLFKVVSYVPLVFACNKNDLRDERAFEPTQLAQIASRYNIGFTDDFPSDMATNYSTSAKTGENVGRAFESLGHLLLSKSIPTDPIKELYESLVAMGISRDSDKSTGIGAFDAIIVDFCEEFDDDRLAMSLIRQETVRAGVDIRNPSKEGLFRFVDYLAEIESELSDNDKAAERKQRRMQWVKGVENTTKLKR